MADWTRLGRYQLIAVLALLLFTPAVLLALTVAFLVFAQSIVLADLSALELVELYLIELATFAVFAYLLYRVARAAVTGYLPGVDGEDDQTRPNDESS
jgi:hypothetical protein